jgi:hypothetical protein
VAKSATCTIAVVRRGRVEAGLDRQRTAGSQPGLELVGRKNVYRTAANFVEGGVGGGHEVRSRCP